MPVAFCFFFRHRIVKVDRLDLNQRPRHKTDDAADDRTRRTEAACRADQSKDKRRKNDFQPTCRQLSRGFRNLVAECNSRKADAHAENQTDHTTGQTAELRADDHAEQDIQKVEEAVCRRTDAFQLVLETDGDQRNGHTEQKSQHRALESAERRAQNGKQNCRHYRVEGVLCRPLAELIVGEAYRHNADAHTEQKPDEAACKPSEHRAQHRPDDAGQNKYGNILCLPRIFQLVHPRNADDADCNAEQ